MLGLVRAWGGAVFVLLVGMVALVRLTPRTVPGQSISLSDQAFRIHVPWLIVVVLMVLVAGLLDWRPPSMRRRLLATLPVPVPIIVAGAVMGAAGATSALTALLYVVEGLLGVGLGLFLTTLFDESPEAPAYS